MSGFLVLEKNKLPIPLSKFLVLPRIFGLALSKLITHLKIFSPSIASTFKEKKEKWWAFIFRTEVGNAYGKFCTNINQGRFVEDFDLE